MKQCKLPSLNEVEVLDDQLVVIKGGNADGEPITCGSGCGLGCGSGCGSFCSGCSIEENPQEPNPPYKSI